MKKPEILSRIDELRDAFAYSLLHKNRLNIGQRICLTQERAAWLEVLEWIEIEPAEPKYVIPKHLELKVQAIIKEIKEKNWIKPNYEPLY
jgi:hypothetical protein